MFKLGLDLHGVIDANPKLFSDLSRRVMIRGGEVHVITGSSITEDLRRQLIQYRIHWTHLFSITDHHKDIRTPISFDDKGHPWIDEATWDKTKAEYCAKMDIDLHIDDLNRYGKHFDTPFISFISEAE